MGPGETTVLTNSNVIYSCLDHSLDGEVTLARDYAGGG